MKADDFLLNIAVSALISVLVVVMFLSIMPLPKETVIQRTTRYLPVVQPFTDASSDIDMGGFMLFNTTFMHICHFSLGPGVTDVLIEWLPAGTLDQDFFIAKLVFAVDEPPGAGKNVNATISDGTINMSVTLTDSQKQGVNTQDTIVVDVSEETLTLCYCQDAGGGASKATVVCLYYYIPNE